ncbi:TlpA family protein disulfide reductase [Stackebrandtia nassauensis]|uniref:Alkyl hydroperoxide reductase/ Thiol specific antioxidant/ Mal allergen n=1 Tax=Stackebrandtia nassauensis (strain DSM 44728 / CIP 108903 / NRRL B-16338 / NBRC 102104 / LLR-40K-21) TaxID=446470 RepID=D3Q834_STANL|nr:TlpA family protein disulfide reductase [Stackebrandtia nassauensis]ADD40539.1 alkyl hydroperoxide reductase/ Thiol specific antioxidant/ Mal allergen [Stackebrandtia nassauensis DSM 44728]
MRTRLLLAGLALTMLAGCAGNQAQATTEDGKTIVYTDESERPKAPTLSGEVLDGEKFEAPDAEVTVVNFWASWCAPCRREGPELVEAYDKTKDDGVAFVGINIRDDRDKGIAFEKGLGVDYPSIFDPSGRLALKYKDVPPNTIPATIVIDDKNRIAAVFRQELTADTLLDAIEDVRGDK